MRAGGALGQLPFDAEQVREEIVAPLGRRLRPGDFEAAGDGVAGEAGAERAGPAHAHRLDAGAFGIGADVIGHAGAVGLAEGVAAGDQRDGLLVVHAHALEGFANVLRRRRPDRACRSGLRD